MSDIYLARDTRPQPAQAALLKDWFDSKDHMVADLQVKALATLLNWARKHWGEHITMQTSPIGFGRELLLNSLPERMHYAQLPEAISEKLHGACSVPHRVENVSHDPTGYDYEYDARVAFLGAARRVPVYFPHDKDAWLHDTGDEYIAGREAWYLTSFIVPAKWDKIGLVPGAIFDTGTRSSYFYPRVPGDRSKRWLHCSEVRLLREHQWSHHIHERAIFAPKDHKGADPLRLWQERLCEALAGCETDINRYLWLRYALRRVALDTIGGFLTNGRAGGLVMTDDGWQPAQGKAVPGLMMRYHQPAWNCAITARCRVAVTRMALNVPPGQLISIKADAIHCTERQEWIPEDTKKVGAYRLKEITQNG